MGTVSTGAAARRSADRAGAPPAPPPRSGRRRDLWIVAGTALLGLAHALVVASHYHVGSFDDDASYVMTARAIVHGTGLGGTLTTGLPLVATYPPGFALLLAPIALVAGSATWPYQALDLAFFVALFPLTHAWLRRAGAATWLRAGVLLLLALNPVAATFAPMIMAEAPFMVAVLGAILLARRWAEEERAVSAVGVGTVLVAAALPWLKEAGVGLVAGLALWLLLRRRVWRAVVLGAAAAAAFAPILALRAAAGTPLAGARYSSEIGGNAGLSSVPKALGEYLELALPDSVVPLYHVPVWLFGVAYSTVPLFAAVGAVRWLRRREDPATVMTLVYLAETLLYPYINERRVVLVLPIVLAWYLAGAETTLRPVGRLLGRAAGWTRLPQVLAVVAALLVVFPLAWQFDRNYRFARGQDTSNPLGSPYLRFVAAVTGPGDVVATPYIWSTSLATGRRTVKDPFDAACSATAVRETALREHAGFAVDAAFALPPPVRDCRREILQSTPWSVVLYRTPFDDAAVYEFVGPGTAHPGLRDALAGAGTPPVSRGRATLTWQWQEPRQLTQLSAGRVASAAGRASSVRMQWRDADGRWHAAASASGPVGPGAGTPFLLWQPPAPVTATGVRLVVAGGTGITADDVHALTVGER